MATGKVELITTNNNGIYQTKKNKKGKEVNAYSPTNCKIISGNGTVITEDIEPKYGDLDKNDYMNTLKRDRSILYLEPMSAHEDKNYLSRDIVLSNEIAELKLDGHRALYYIGEESNRLFSRGISKVTGWWGENTDQVPHFRDLLLKEYAGTVLDGELDYGSTSMGVQSVTGALPATAIQYQFNNGFVNFFGFDILYYKGVNIQAMPLWKRKVYLMKVLLAFNKVYGICGMEILPMYVNAKSASSIIQKWAGYLKGDDFLLSMLDNQLELVDSFKGKFREVLDAEREGLIIKDINGRYEQKRSKAFIKLKGVSTWDCVMMGVTEPTKVYAGKELETWKYWENPDGSLFKDENVKNGVHETYLQMSKIPVTKPYFMGWCGAIEFGVWKNYLYEEAIAKHGAPGIDQLIDEGRMEVDGDNFRELVKVGDCKGLTEKVQEDLKLRWTDYVVMGRVLEVKANGILDEEIGSLRHPRFKKWRDDKNQEDCIWDDHIRNVWE